jgi:cell division septal protein FtsQ
MVGALAAGFALGAIVQGDSFFSRFLRDHTPEVQIKAPEHLQNLPVRADLPKRTYLFWIPGVGRGAREAIIRKFPTVKDVRFDKDFNRNQVRVHLSPRKPLIQWNDRGMDEDGVIFSIAVGGWAHLPKALFPPTGPQPRVGAWLEALAQQKDLWNQVGAVGQDKMGNMFLDLKTGARIIWGGSDAGAVPLKSSLLGKALKDAHERLGGAAAADLRFFDEGRIIVRPKSVK